MRKSLKNQTGALIVMVALLLPVMLGMVGLVIDIGYAYIQRTNLQHVADAAALAGAAKIQDETIATALAQAYIEKNAGTTVKTTDITFTMKNQVKQINVDLTKYSQTFFLKVFDLNGMDVNVHAAAVGLRQPTIFDYALVTTDPDKFTIFGGGAPPDSMYVGSIYTNANNLKINEHGGQVSADRLGEVFCPSSLPSDIKNFSDTIQNKFHKDAETIDITYDNNGNNKNPDIQARIDKLKNQATKTYESGFSNGDFKFPNNCIYVKGDFYASAGYDGGNAFCNAAGKGELTIIADGNITIQNAGNLPANANVTLCSINGNITYNGGATNGAKFTCIAPIGTVDMNCSTLEIDGAIICNKFKVGNCGKLVLKNSHNSDDSGNTTLKLIE